MKIDDLTKNLIRQKACEKLYDLIDKRIEAKESVIIYQHKKNELDNPYGSERKSLSLRYPGESLKAYEKLVDKGLQNSIGGVDQLTKDIQREYEFLKNRIEVIDNELKEVFGPCPS